MSQTTQNNPKTDLAPFEIWEVMLDNSTIKFHEPLVLTPTRMPHDPDEPGDVEYWEVIRDDLGIDVYAKTHDDLMEALHSNIRMNWKHYVLAPDDRISSGARAIKLALLDVAEVVDG